MIILDGFSIQDASINLHRGEKKFTKEKIRRQCLNCCLHFVAIDLYDKNGKNKKRQLLCNPCS